jgi:hypothetical protein
MYYAYHTHAQVCRQPLVEQGLAVQLVRFCSLSEESPQYKPAFGFSVGALINLALSSENAPSLAAEGAMRPLVRFAEGTHPGKVKGM